MLIKIDLFYIFRFVLLFHLSLLIVFSVFITIFHHGQGHWSFIQKNRSKLSIPTLKKPGLSPSACHISSASNSTRTSISSRIDNKHITNNQNKNNIPNKDGIQSFVIPRKQNYSVLATYTPTHLTPLNATLTIPYIKLHTTTKLPPAGK